MEIRRQPGFVRLVFLEHTILGSNHGQQYALLFYARPLRINPRLGRWLYHWIIAARDQDAAILQQC